MDIITADWHYGHHRKFGGKVDSFGLNERSLYMLGLIEDLLDKKHCYIAGDLVDTSRMSANLLYPLTRSLLKADKVTILRGNHDIANDSMSPLNSLFLHPKIQEHSEEDNLIFPVPYRAGLSGAEQFKAVSSNGQNYAVCHLGISTEKDPIYMRESLDQIPLKEAFKWCKKNNIEVLYAGNWHKNKVWQDDGVTVIQIGALFPTGFDNEGYYGYGSVFTPGSIMPREIPGPRFIKTNSFDMDTSKQKDGYKYYYKVMTDVDLYDADLAKLTALKESNTIEDFELALPEKSRARLTAKSKEVFAKDNMRSLVFSWLKEQDLDEALIDKVLDKSLEYLDNES